MFLVARIMNIPRGAILFTLFREDVFGEVKAAGDDKGWTMKIPQKH